jgi:hypothetical protein
MRAPSSFASLRCPFGCADVRFDQMQETNWKVIFAIILPAALAVLFLCWMMPAWVAGVTIENCRKLSNIETNLKIVLDLAVFAPFIVNLAYELTKSSEKHVGPKDLTRAGYLSLVVFVILTSANILVTRAGAIIAQKIEADSKANFDSNLKLALKRKNEELIAEFKPTLEEQKRLVRQSTEQLTQQVGAASDRLKAGLSASGDHMARTMVQVGNEIEFADIPLSAVVVTLNIPELETDTRLPGGIADLSESDNKTDSFLLNNRKKTARANWLTCTETCVQATRIVNRLSKIECTGFGPVHSLTI